MSEVYDDAELAALEVVREAVMEFYGEPRSAEILEAAMPLVEKHDIKGMQALIVALARLTANTWIVQQQCKQGISPNFPTEEEMLAALESFELHKLEQHEEDGS
jgi:hypothetical protein